MASKHQGTIQEMSEWVSQEIKKMSPAEKAEVRKQMYLQAGLPNPEEPNPKQ
jgi:hypothetical protein